MIETFGPVMAIIVMAFLLFLVGGIIFIAIFDRDDYLDAEISAAQERLNAEEHRFRVGEIDRRNLMQ